MGVMRFALLLVGAAGMLGACGGDAGDDWHHRSDAPQMISVYDVWAFSETDVWFVDGTPTVHRFDGQSWSTLETPTLGGVVCIFALSETDVLLCAGNEMLHYDGAAFTAMDVTTPTGLNGLIDIWASSPTDIWTVGDDAIVAHYDGATWTRTLTGSAFASSIWGSGPTDIYVTSTFDVLHYDGTEWTEVELEFGGGGEEVWGTDASDVWVMTDSYELHHFDGSAWETVEPGDDFVGDLATIWGPAPDDLWAAGSAGSLAHWDGSSWSEVHHQKIGAPFLRVFAAMHGTSSTDVWAVGYQLGEGGGTGIIWHYEP
jgi:hypothetical protein